MAESLFAAHGYVATTLPSIAREAGVSPATVTVVFGTKPALLDAPIKSAVRGDDTPAPMSQRAWWQEMLREPDPGGQLALFAVIGRRIHERTTDIAEIVRGRPRQTLRLRRCARRSASHVYKMLVVERGWSPEHYERWLASSLICSLLGWARFRRTLGAVRPSRLVSYNIFCCNNLETGREGEKVSSL